MSTTKQVALVTGASSGIGEATAHALAAAGFTVIGTSRKATGLTERDGIAFIGLDVADDASVAAAVQQAIAAYGRIDVLVNNAGVGSAGAAEERSIEQDQQLFDINVFGVARMTKAVLPHMRERGSGRIINVSSGLGFTPAPFMAAYSASKHAVEGYTESLDHEIREHGVRALLVEPVFTKTAFEANLGGPATPLPVYERRRAIFDEVMKTGIAEGEDPSVVAATVVTAATDPRPKLRYTAGKAAGQIAVLRRFVPAKAFDKQLRKLYRLPASA
jgi:NAD(P)-dependent dehydrogenase (short-subunit alcohol dehydrogenase family)